MLNYSLSRAKTYYKGSSTQINQQTKVPGESDKDTQARQPLTTGEETGYEPKQNTWQSKQWYNHSGESTVSLRGAEVLSSRGKYVGEMPSHSVY